jgi:hypothetical protein
VKSRTDYQRWAQEQRVAAQADDPVQVARRTANDENGGR